MARNEGHGTLCISSFHGLAHKPPFMAASTRPGLAYFLHYLHDCIYNTPCQRSLPTGSSTCLFNYHPCRTGMSSKKQATVLQEFHRGCNSLGATEFLGWGVGGDGGVVCHKRLSHNPPLRGVSVVSHFMLQKLRSSS